MPEPFSSEYMVKAHANIVENLPIKNGSISRNGLVRIQSGYLFRQDIGLSLDRMI